MTEPTNLHALLGDRYDAMHALARDKYWRRGYTEIASFRMAVDAALAAVLPDLLAEALNQGRAEGWDEGHAAGWDDYAARSDVPDLTNTPNPHRTDGPAHCDRGPCHLPRVHGGPCNPGGDALDATETDHA